MVDVTLKCRCGAVQGVARNVSADTGTRIVCYCDDCQAFARYLDQEDTVLDEYGGTDIFQITPAQVEITQGAELIRCMRLTEKGLFRWYTACCKTPIGNTLSAGVPFVGIIHNFMDDDGVRDQNLGPVRGHVLCKFARGTLPAARNQTGFPLRLVIRALSRLLVAKLRGQNRPSPFFNSNGIPVSAPQISKATAP